MSRLTVVCVDTPEDNLFAPVSLKQFTTSRQGWASAQTVFPPSPMAKLVSA